MANIVLGAGKVYFDMEDSAGALAGGERYIAETPGFSLSVTPETLQDWSSDGPVQEKLLDITTRVDRSGTLTVKDISTANLALWLAGASSTVNQSNTPVTDEAHSAVVADQWYQLGASASNPAGVRNVTSVSIDGSGGTPTYVLDTDYELDAEQARFRPIAGGSMAGNDVEANYTPASETRDRIATDQLGPKTGALRLIANNTAGTNRDIYIPKVQMAPDGDIAFKSRDTVMLMSFSLLIGIRTGYAQVYVDGRAA